MSQQTMSQLLPFLSLITQRAISPRTFQSRSPKGSHRFFQGIFQRWQPLVLGLGLALMGGCASPVSIASLKQQSGQGLDGQLVYIEGKAVDRVPLLDGRVYRIEDGTGWIWVLSQGPEDEIALGKTVRLKAELRYQDIAAGQAPGGNQSSQNELYAVERQRLP